VNAEDNSLLVKFLEDARYLHKTLIVSIRIADDPDEFDAISEESGLRGGEPERRPSYYG
jgi:hypothetical protein